MKNYILTFLKRGLLFSVTGPIIYIIIILILGLCNIIDILTYQQLVLGVFSSIIIAFCASGISVIYEIEKLPLLFASLFHSVILYIVYILMFLINGWLKGNYLSIILFTASYFILYLIIWIFIYISIRVNLNKMNKKIN